MWNTQGPVAGRGRVVSVGPESRQAATSTTTSGTLRHLITDIELPSPSRSAATESSDSGRTTGTAGLKQQIEFENACLSPESRRLASLRVGRGGGSRGSAVSQHAGRVSRHDRPVGDVPGHDGTGPYHRFRPDGDAGEDHGPGADGRPPLHQRALQGPVRIAFAGAVRVGRGRPAIVQEIHVVADEDLILDRDALADEGVALDLAPGPDPGTLLNLDERPDGGLVTDLAAVQVDEREEPHVPAQLHVGRDTPGEGIALLGGKRGHRPRGTAVPSTGIGSPPATMDRCAASRMRTTRHPARPSAMSVSRPPIAWLTLSVSTPRASRVSICGACMW